jgi:hypothetical protein
MKAPASRENNFNQKFQIHNKLMWSLQKGLAATAVPLIEKNHFNLMLD